MGNDDQAKPKRHPDAKDHGKASEEEDARVLSEILTGMMELGAIENAEKIGKLADQILTFAKSGLRPEELMSLAPQTALKKLQETVRLFQPTELSEELRQKIQNHEASFLRAVDAVADNMVPPESPQLQLHPAGPALLEFLQNQRKSIEKEIFAEAMVKLHKEFQDSVAHFFKVGRLVYEIPRLQKQGLLPFEYLANTIISVLGALAEHPYKNLLRIALTLTQMSSGMPIGAPSMLGPIMKDCEKFWREGRGPNILLDDRARLIRNSIVHGDVRIDIDNKTITFMDKGNVAL